MLPIKKILSCLFVLIFVYFGTPCSAADVGTTTPDPTVTEPATQNTDQTQAEKEKSDASAGGCCHTRGAPECGGTCDICCKTGQTATCDAGSCNPNNPFACTCERMTSCNCE